MSCCLALWTARCYLLGMFGGGVVLAVRVVYDRGMEAKGSNGRVSFDGQTLRISRGTFSRQGKGEKVIPLASVGAVQLRRPSWGAALADGAWSVSVLGEVGNSESRRGRGNARREGRFDENTIILGSQHVKAFEALTAAINEAKASPATVAPPVAPVPDAGREALVSQLRQLGAMHHRGSIDDATFIREMHVLLPQL